MYRTFLVALILIGTLSFADDTQVTEKKSNKTVTFAVTGMDCPTCAKMISSVYTKLKGVESAEADADKGSLIVKYDSKKISEKELLAALKEKPKYTVSKEGKSQ
ncbi:heavy-metal-associated domain-containing protein [Oscillatoria laete-virens NRMC-F 0139]|nr:heavy-metal-associated domain-containing protein [Oscillatoria laete-virens]MDL5055708.1 heavy-metal-associated domain-containing protein [Oscillatoria laete-virens NRMC-F 0139]